MILIWTAMSVFLVGALVLAGTDEIRAVDRLAQADHGAQGQAREVAHAGIVDAYAWFRRQPIQPVAAFAPARDLGAVPPVNETDDPSRGLVRTFEISPGLWGVYEVRPGTGPEAYSDADGNGIFDAGEAFVDDNEDGRWTPGRGTRDVSPERGVPGTGTSWLLMAEGRIYKRPRLDLPLGEGPNQLVGRARTATEIRRLTIVPPAAAAICCSRADGVSLGNRARVRGHGYAALSWAPSTGSPSMGGAEVEGGTSSVPGYDADVEQVFGVGWDALRSMADVSTANDAEGLVGPIPTFGLVVISGDTVFTEDRPLRGTGVVLVDGDVTLDPGSNSFFNGLLYVRGRLTARAPAFLRGTVIVTGDVDARGTGGDYCEIEYDSGMVASLLSHMGQYRYSKAAFTPAPTLVDGRPSELHASRRRLGTGYAQGLGGEAGDGAAAGE